MKPNANVLRAEQWTAVPNGNGTPKPLQQTKQRHKLLDWRSLLFGEVALRAQTTDGEGANVRVPNAVFAAVIVIVLFIASTAGTTIWLLARLDYAVEDVKKEQQLERQSIDAWKAYVNKETLAVGIMEEKLPNKAREEMRQWRRDNPNPKPQN